MAKSDLYKLSGHWDHYKDGMFVLGDEEKDDEVFALRPMTCPFQYQAYLNRQRSYRDLPLRYNETSTLFRNEASGEMHGLIRVRQFTISEGHLMCTPQSSWRTSSAAAWSWLSICSRPSAFTRTSPTASPWDPDDREKYIGTPSSGMRPRASCAGFSTISRFPTRRGSARRPSTAPSSTSRSKTSSARKTPSSPFRSTRCWLRSSEWSMSTLTAKKKNPYIIHRTSIGCYERTLALLIEKYAGALPMWLMPEQVRVLPLSERLQEKSREVEAALAAAGIRVTTDLRNEKIGYKIREAQLEKIPYMLVVGDKEAESGTVSVRSRRRATSAR